MLNDSLHRNNNGVRDMDDWNYTSMHNIIMYLLMRFMILCLFANWKTLLIHYSHYVYVPFSAKCTVANCDECATKPGTECDAGKCISGYVILTAKTECLSKLMNWALISMFENNKILTIE